jgi:hypothetical protein
MIEGSRSKSRRPKTCGSGGSGSATLMEVLVEAVTVRVLVKSMRVLVQAVKELLRAYENVKLVSAVRGLLQPTGPSENNIKGRESVVMTMNRERCR